MGIKRLKTHSLSCLSLTHTYNKEKGEQKQRLASNQQYIQELERQLKSLTDVMKVENQNLQSVQKVG